MLLLSVPISVADRGGLSVGELDELAIDGLSLGPYLSAEQQKQLADDLRKSGQLCLEVAHPMNGGRRPLPDPLSADRDERRAALQVLNATIERAARHNAERVVLYPSRVTLHQSVGLLSQRFAEGRTLNFAPLFEQRAALSEPMLDRLLKLLDGALRAAERVGLTIALPGPAPWPHNFPRQAEVALLLDEFAGGPLEATFFSDWQTIARRLGTDDQFWTDTPAARLSAACGLTSGLPPSWAEPTVVPSAERITLYLRIAVSLEEARTVVEAVRERLAQRPAEPQTDTNQQTNQQDEPHFVKSPSGLLLPY
ncbi:MAG: hypothetical protein H6707_09245 [Deltaproteobacteria bacterium]|nr:hypothetical protein [Deltaproteobacteria bacterium]